MSQPNPISCLSTEQLLTREAWDLHVRQRDGHKCACCGKPVDAVHHIMERRLWADGGYYPSNGVCLCADCHLLAEKTLISCSDLRAKAGIRATLLPDHLTQEEGETYDKWGNQFQANGLRLKGEMFFEEQCQKILADQLSSFAQLVKYPKTLHVPWSPNLQNDDRRIPNFKAFVGQEVVITEKLDGENTTFTDSKLHARSLDSRNHPSRNWAKSLHAMVQQDIPPGYRFCGENMYALHSIPYTNLPSYFLLFNIWAPTNVCLSWDDTLTYAELLGLHTVPILWRGIWDQAMLESFHKSLDPDKQEGYVVRLTRAIRMSEFRLCFAKWVRHNHVQTDQLWMLKPVVPNTLKPGATGFPS